MNFVQATASYEQWLGKRLEIVSHDLELKHEAMGQAVFPFLRATFYRFAQLWKAHAGDLARATKVLAVGDLHVANFGTWRDIEGRLVWGINDFDEVYPLPYTFDLVRLAVSAHVATAENHLAIAAADACDSILAGYQDGMDAGGRPFVLAEEHKWLRDTVTGDLRDPVDFWRKMASLHDCVGAVPKIALRGLERMLPEHATVDRVVQRVAGLGSLGRQRYVVLGTLHGSRVAREAKALCASACLWAGMRGGGEAPLYNQALDTAVRALDPYVKIKAEWIFRRLAPYCSRVDLGSLPKQREESRLLRAMGFELANVHLGTSGARKKILADLKGRPRKWLHKSAAAFRDLTSKDFDAWKAANR